MILAQFQLPLQQILGDSIETNAIYEGDNLEILSKFPSNSIDLIYADPPFFSNKHYEVIWKDGAEKRAFEDRWKGGIEHYIAWMEPRIREMHRVLKDTGSIYLHCDWHANAHLRILMDKIFGEKNFRNEIIWHYRTGGISKKWFGRKHDTIFFYTKTKKYKFNPIEVREYYKDIYGDWFKPGLYDRKSGKDENGYFHFVYKDDVWEIPAVFNMSKEYAGYPTQKPESLLEMIIKASSNKNDIVLDPFCGCGTALVVAQRLNRRWVGIDISPTACKLMRKRLQERFGINPPIIRGEVDINYVKKLSPFEFQNWVVVDKFFGIMSPKKSNDSGIDGYTSPVMGGYPIQVKQSENVGREVVDKFETAMRRAKKKKGYIVAFSFGKGAYEEAARAKNEEGLEIILKTVDELLQGKVD